ncbi:hypothetical protein M422DRAFT_272003 [Sphaerobolus stellatus SS14]|uniref:Uncharacterized protein n=1 Tax=Sphaerobolus stellatus (strain SS14) TaxID=990650 RepID=A0A0C9UN12_SPHS4|nr:hypothetical protein M422DRAFT_272003 [Sphaerobolus stellatus SS14]
MTSTNIQEIISDHSLGNAVVTKPSSSGTLHRLQIAILALIPSSADTRRKHFPELARSIYRLANISSAVPILSTMLTKPLFVNIREQALLFLASVCTHSLLDDIHSAVLPQPALFHAAAFLKAQISDSKQPQDFQTIIPSILIALRAHL